MVVKTTLPLLVLEAIERFTKASQAYGYAVACHNAQVHESELASARAQVDRCHAAMVTARGELVTAIETHASVLYEGGLELGRLEVVAVSYR